MHCAHTVQVRLSSVCNHSCYDGNCHDCDGHTLAFGVIKPGSRATCPHRWSAVLGCRTTCSHPYERVDEAADESAIPVCPWCHGVTTSQRTKAITLLADLDTLQLYESKISELPRVKQHTGEAAINDHTGVSDPPSVELMTSRKRDVEVIEPLLHSGSYVL